MKKFWLLAIPAALCVAAVVSACASDDAVEAETYKVVYMNGDEVFFSAKVTAGEELPVPENDPERADEGNIVYTFAGWTDDAEGGVGDVVDLDEVTAVTTDLTYYAVFDAVSYYTVTFKDGVTGLTIDEQKVPAGGDAEEPEKPEHEGYEFVEWDGSFTDISARTTVTAVYKKLSYTLSLDVLGVITETPVEYGAALAPAAPATVAGLKFDGWYIKGEEGEPVLLSEAYKSMPAHAVEAYAEFSVDWTVVDIAVPANAVYGGEGATIAHPAYGNMTYTHIWGDGSRGDSYVFGGAGLQTVSATVTAVFENEHGVRISETSSLEEKTVNVRKAELEITASVANLSNGSVVYGTAPAAEFTFSGFVGEDDSSDLGSVSAVYTFENGQPADAEKLEAGAYIISASLEDDNYIANVRTSLFLVKPRDITLTLTAGDITYGAQPEFTVSADKSQFAYGEDISVLRQGTVVIKKDGAVVSGNLAAGSYTAETGGYKNANYNVIHGTAQFTVKKAALTATVSVQGSYEYGTEVKPGLSYEGFVFGDDGSVVDESALKFTFNGGEGGKLGVGSYTVAASGATAANYEISYKEGSFEVTKKTLTVTAEAEDFTYGGRPAPKAQYSGFAYGEDETSLGGTLKFTYEKEGKPFSGAFGAGSYTVKAGGLTSENYDINYVGGTFEVLRAKLTVTVSVENSYVYADAITPEVSYSPFANGDNAGSLGGKLAFSYNGSAAEGYLPVGSYTVTAAGLASDNYEIVYAYGNSSFKVTARTVTVTLSEGATSGNVWQYSDFGKAGVLSGLPEGFAFAGTLELNKTGEGTYTAKGGSLGDDFEWAQPYSVTLGGEDVTANFAFEYDISVTLTDSQFNITSTGTVNTPYTGKEIALGTGIVVQGAPDDMRITYSLKEEGEYAEDIPVGVNAGVYTVYYKITAENYEDYSGSYTATISKANNEITFAGYGEFTYTGEEQTFPLDKFSAAFGEVRLAEGENKGTDAGRYTFTVGVEGTDNWNASEFEVTVEIKKAANTLILTLDYADLTYNGAAQTFGDFAEHFSATYGMPELVGGETNVFTDAGSHNFKVYVPESDNYLASDEVSVPVKILKNTENKITFTPYGTFTYTGEEQIFPLENFSATFGDVKVTVGSNRGTDAGEYRFTVSVQDTANYNGCEYQVSVTINKAKYTDGQIPEKALRADTLYCVPGEENIITAEDLAAGFSFPAGTSSVEYTNGENKLTLVYNADGSVNKNYEPAQTDRFVTAWYKVQVVLNDNAAFTARVNTLSQFNGNISELIRAVEAPEGLDPAINKDNIATYLSCDSQAVVFNAGGTYPVIYTAADTLADSYIKIVFGREESDSAVVPFKVTSVKVGEELYTIEDALLNAKSGDTLIVTANTSFADSSVIDIYGVNATVADGKSVYGFTLGSNVTLLLPYDQSKIAAADANCEDNTASAKVYADTNPSFLKLTLIVPDYISLDVSGTISIGAVLGSTGQGLSGHTSGAYAQVTLNGTLDLNSGSKLYSYGYIKGTGKVNAYSGSEMTSPFVVRDFRGGTYTAASYNSSIAPFSQYELPNIQTPMHIVYGAKYYARASLYANSSHNTTIATIIGDGGLIQLKENGYIETSFEHITDTTKYGNTTAAGITTLELFGGAKDNTLSLDVGVPVTTSSCLLGIPYNFNLIFVEGTYEIDMQYKLMPGASIEIGEEASVIFNNKLIVYTNDFVDKEAIGYLYPTNVDDATLKVSGSATFNKGFGGNISAQSGATITFGAGVALTIESDEAIKHSGFLLFSWISEKQTIEKFAQLAGYTGNIAAGNTYKYDGSGWVEQPAQQA